MTRSQRIAIDTCVLTHGLQSIILQWEAVQRSLQWALATRQNGPVGWELQYQQQLNDANDILEYLRRHV